MTSLVRLSPVAIAAIASSLASPLLAQTGSQITASYGTHVVLDGELGVGSFQDIQVPANMTTGTRGDGTAIDAENATHGGMPFVVGLGLEKSLGDVWTWTVAHLDGMQMVGLSGPQETQGASYSRIDLSTSARGVFPMGPVDGTLGATAGLRRISFANVSDSHYINALMLGGSLGLQAPGQAWSVEAAFAASPVARFGYSDTAVLGGHDMPGSRASLSDFVLSGTYQLRRDVWLVLGFDREVSTIAIADITQYDSFGLSVIDPGDNSRQYNLVTTTTQLGLRKAF